MELKRRQPMGIELVKKGIVTQDDIAKALEFQKLHPNLKLGDCIYRLGLCEPMLLIKTIGEVLGQKGILLNKNMVKVNLADYISFDIAKENQVVPFEVDSGKIKVCFSDLANSKQIDTIRLLLLNKGLIMEPYITFSSEISKILETEDGHISNDLMEVNPNVTITNLVDSIIKTGMEKRASDIHIEPMDKELRIRYRIDGELFTAATIAKEKQPQIIGRLKAISNMHQEKQEPQDGRILLYENYNIRVSSQPNVYGEKFVLRLLKKDDKIRDIFELGYMGTKEQFEKYVDKKNSITIIAAPTGEGKTTTLYSIIDHLNKPEINITTIEEPVEIRIQGLNQIEIDNKITFASSLRTVLRQDPDIILVGEIRDEETAEIAIQAGQTGHYVLSTIHTIDSIEVINRLRKVGVSDYDIASSLATSISQRLVRRVCPKCKKERLFNEQEKETMQKIFAKYHEEVSIDEFHTYETVGCEYCNHTGYYNRISIFEFLEINEEIRELIVKGASSIEIRKRALEGSYRPLIIDGMKKVLQGYTTLEELNKKLLFF